MTISELFISELHKAHTRYMRTYNERPRKCRFRDVETARQAVAPELSSGHATGMDDLSSNAMPIAFISNQLGQV